MNKTKVGIVGSGAMGAGIAQVAATSGHQVLVFDSNSSAIEKAKTNLKNTFDKLVEKSKIDHTKADEIIGRITFINDIHLFKDCGLIIEAIIENLEIKQKVFSDLEKVVSPDCILASNTSSLSIASIASACERPERVIGIHFFNPVPLMALVEIIPAVQTDHKITEQSKQLINSWGKYAVVCKDTPGFIVNRIARPFYGEAIRIMEEGIADMPTIDWAMKEIGGFRMGPFELMDFIGHDVNYKVTETVWTQFFFDSRYKPSLSQKRLYEAKRFGKKSGIGFYDYREGSVMTAPKKDTELGKKIFDRIIAMLINEASDALYLQVSSRDSIDNAMTKGVNYPKGLLKWADEIGLAMVLSQLDNLRNEYQEERYRASVLLRQMVRDKKNFY